MKGSKCTRTGLWFVNINRNRQLANMVPKMNGMANLAMNNGHIQHTDHQAFGAAASIPTSSKAELAMFHHQTLGPFSRSNSRPPHQTSTTINGNGKRTFGTPKTRHQFNKEGS